MIDNKDDKNMLSFRESLKLIKKVNTDNMPDKFFDITTNNYNLFVFKTKNETYRLGIAVSSDNVIALQEIMRNWEKETNKDRKMAAVLKGIFLDDPIKENYLKSFESALYKNVNIRYIHMPDSRTALNYFIYNNILVITTSKDSAFLLVDLLTNG